MSPITATGYVDRLPWILAFAMFVLLVVVPFVALEGRWMTVAFRDSQAIGWILPSARTLGLLFNSLTLAVTVAVLATFLGYAVALWLCSANGRLQRIGRQAYLVPLFIPPYLHALAWMAMAGRRQFLDQAVALAVGPDRVSISAYGFGAAVLVLVFALAPIATLFSIAKLEAVEAELSEQACLLRPDWAVVRAILIPITSPALLVSGGLIFSLALVEYGVPAVLQYNVYTMEIYSVFSQDNNPMRAAALAITLILPAGIVLAGSQWLSKSNPLRGQGARPLRVPFGGWPAIPRVWMRIGLLAAASATVGPIVVLLLRVGGPDSSMAAISLAQRELGNSLLVAAAVAFIAAPVATALANGMRSRLAAAGWLLYALPLAVPSPLVGVAWVYLANHPWLEWSYGTLVPVAFAHLGRLLPFAIFAAATQVRRIDHTLLEAASLHDVGFLRRAVQVHIPLMAPALLLAWTIAFVLSLGELGASLMVAPPGEATLPMMIYNLMHYGATDTVASLALVGLGTAAAVCALALMAGKVIWPWTT